MKLPVLFLLFILASCSNPFNGPGSLNFKIKDFKQDPLIEENRLRLLREEKDTAWKEIVVEAVESFQDIQPTIQKKCFACHDANTKTPIYGRILTSVNPVYRHQKDGIKALDFSQKFPLLALGNPSQLSLLRAIRNEVVERSMPLKAYTAVYRNRKVNQSDEEQILAWVDPLIEKIEDFDTRYQNNGGGPEAGSRKIFELKCFRCHANGNDRGQFGNMQETQEMIKRGFINLNDPLKSSIYKLSVSKKMPPNPRDALTAEELLVVGDWLESLPKENP